jgi:hypothetical protein
VSPNKLKQRRDVPRLPNQKILTSHHLPNQILTLSCTVAELVWKKTYFLES